MSMWDDFRVFDLRREDRAYEKPQKNWGEVDAQYSFFLFSGKKLPCEIHDLLTLMYKEQAVSGNREFAKPHARFRDKKEIKSEQITNKNKKLLASSINFKEQALTYLTTHYHEMDKKSRPIEMLTIAFCLPDNWQGEEKIRAKVKQYELFPQALNELRRRFTILKKKIISDRLYAVACGYSRLILINDKFEPYYLVNFFFRKNKDNIVDGNIPLDIYDKWIDSGEKKNRQHERVYYCLFENASRPEIESNDRLFVLSSQAFLESCRAVPDDITLILTKNTNGFSEGNNRKGYLRFIRLQSQIYNAIPGVRSLSSSTEFTYLNAEKREKRKLKKNAKKSRLQNQRNELKNIIPPGEISAKENENSSLESGGFLFDEIMPSNMEEHLRHLKKHSF
ncbi:hypothetical protein ACIPSX_00890 [Pectobacterium sp. CHL-2024]|uniref:hypothetical protein n=1 Tax=Pectobacterium sp. CHL-2024 TaxID=3377079 RepID=UPI0038048057